MWRITTVRIFVQFVSFLVARISVLYTEVEGVSQPEKHARIIPFPTKQEKTHTNQPFSFKTQGKTGTNHPVSFQTQVKITHELSSLIPNTRENTHESSCLIQNTRKYELPYRVPCGGPHIGWLQTPRSLQFQSSQQRSLFLSRTDKSAPVTSSVNE